MIPWPKVLSEVKSHAESDPTREACGIIFKDGTTLRCPNVAERPEYRYEIFSGRLAQFDRDDIEGFYLSHVDRSADPTFRDAAQSVPGKRYIIAGMQGGVVTEWRAFVGAVRPYSGERHLVAVAEPGMVMA